MKRAELRALVLDLLTREELTPDALYVRLNTYEPVRLLKLGRPWFTRMIRAMLSNGAIAYAYCPGPGLARRRLRAAFVAYRAVRVREESSWLVLKYDGNSKGGTVLGSNLTQDDARVCVEALNARDRKARGLKLRGGKS